MKLTKTAKKPKPALSKVTKMKGTKKSVKELPVHESKKLAVLESVKDSLKSPEKKKIDGALKRLAKKKLSPSKAVVSKEQKQPDSIEVSLSPSLKKSKKNKLEKQAKVSKKSSKMDLPQMKKSKKSLKVKKDVSLVKTSVDVEKDALNKKPVKKQSLVKTSVDVEKDALNKKPVKKQKKVMSAGTPSKEKIATTKGKKLKKNTKAAEATTKGKKLKKNTKPAEIQLDPNLLIPCCEASLKLIAVGAQSKPKEDLFFNLGEPVLMQIDTFKIPKTAPRSVRCEVPHGLYGSDPDICLIVPDLKRGRKRDQTYANFVEQYEEMLCEKGVTQIKQVIPFTALRSEYSQYEVKRRLAKMFDVFLCDGRILGHVVHFLGTVFLKAKKVPFPVHAVKHENKVWSIAPNLKEVVEKAARKVHISIHPYGTSTSVHVGHSSLTPKQLADNVQAVWQKLSTSFPGGVANIRTAYLKGPQSLPAPFYTSLIPPPNVPVAKAPGKKLEPVEGELSTVLGQHVKVMPDGDIIVTDHKTKEDIDFLKVDPNSIPKKAVLKRKLKEQKKKSKRIKSGRESDDDPIEPEENVVDEDIDDIDLRDVDAAENAYLAQWSESNSLQEIEQEQKTKVKKEKSEKTKHSKKQAKKGSSKNGAKSVEAAEKLSKEKPKTKKNKHKNIETENVIGIQKKVLKVKGKQAKVKNEVTNASVQNSATKKHKSDKGLKRKGGKA